MSQLYLADKLIASTEGSDIKYDENTSLKEKIDELNSNMVASDNTPFRFGVNEDGEYGYIVTDSEGADTVIPFKNLINDTPANASADQITEGYTAWVNGELIIGTRPAPSGQQFGTVDMTTPSKTTKSTQINFNPEFDTIPSVTVIENANSTRYDTWASNITRAGFTLNAYNSSSGGWTLSVTWTAKV